jgi:hypothetical protein
MSKTTTTTNPRPTSRVRELGLVRGHVVAALHDEALGVEEPDLLAALLDGDARLAVDGVGDEVGDADGRLARAEEEEGLHKYVVGG